LGWGTAQKAQQNRKMKNLFAGKCAAKGKRRRRKTFPAERRGRRREDQEEH